MADQIEERLAELINLAQVEVEGNKKVEYLYQIKELTLNHGLLSNFFQNILAFQNDRAPNVKKFVSAFIEAACQKDCQLCPKAILSLNLLLNDTNTEVLKRSIQTATQFYRSLVQWIATASAIERVKIDSASLMDVQAQPLSSSVADTTTTTATSTTIKSTQQFQLQQTQQNLEQPPADSKASLKKIVDEQQTRDDIEQTWLMWMQIKSFICNLLETSNNDGVRTHCVKFIETLILMQTPKDKYTDAGSYELNLIDQLIKPVTLSSEATQRAIKGLPTSSVLFNEEHKLELVEAAKKRFDQLVVFHGMSHISSVNLMAAMQSLVVLAKQRYRLFMGRVIQAMESLNVKLPPTLTESQVQSVKKFLKVQLTVMLKHPYSLDRYQTQITQLLQAVGSKQPEIHKVISDFKHKFGCEPLAPNNNANEMQKRIKLETGIKPQLGSQAGSHAKSKHLDLNKLTQELDEKEKRQIVVDSVKRILSEEKRTHLSPAQMDIKKKVLSTLAYEFNSTECPQIIQDYIFDDLRNRHEICYAVIRKNFDIALKKATKRQISLSDNQELLKDYFDCFNSYLNRAMDLRDNKDRELVLERLYALRDEYYNQDRDPEEDHEHALVGNQ